MDAGFAFHNQGNAVLRPALARDGMTGALPRRSASPIIYPKHHHIFRCRIAVGQATLSTTQNGLTCAFKTKHDDMDPASPRTSSFCSASRSVYSAGPLSIVLLDVALLGTSSSGPIWHCIIPFLAVCMGGAEACLGRGVGGGCRAARFVLALKLTPRVEIEQARMDAGGNGGSKLVGFVGVVEGVQAEVKRV